jgi:chorismate mutase
MSDLKKEICHWRVRINKIDLQLVNLLNKRANYASEIGKLKLRLGIEAFSLEREKEVLQNVTGANHGPLDIKAINRLFCLIIGESRRVERDTMEKVKKTKALMKVKDKG